MAMQRLVRKVLRAVADYDPEYYDMYADANEACFAQLYLERITQGAQAAGIRPPATLLEAGCQAGRLLVPFAKMGFRATGIDTSRFALRRAREHARQEQVDVTLTQGDLMKVLDGRRNQYDIVVCAEVMYLSRSYRDMLRTLAGAVRPGGLLCVSHRPRFYYLVEALRQYDFSTAQEVLARSEGPFRDSAYYNWQTEEELRSLYGSLGVRDLAMYPIDRWAWLAGLNPGQLSAEQRQAWVQLELNGDGSGAACARYVLVMATMPQGV